MLASHGVLPDGKVTDYQNMASFRNMLVHHYESIEDETVFGIFKNKFGDFDLFRDFILEYVKNMKRNMPKFKG
jgi:uncharacterized protein YutE (UPF0331/DUF86 family)